MKLNSLTSLTHPFRRPATKVALAGCFAFAVQVACSDAPQNGTPTFPSTAGTPSTSGASSTSGAPGTAGTFTSTAGTAGSFGTAGTGFETGGTAGTGGGGGTDAGGTAGASTAGTGGVYVPPAPFCMNHAVAPLPYKVNDNYYPSGWSEGGPTAQISTPAAGLATDYCTQRPAGAVGECTKWRYTPAAAGGTAVWVIWEVPAAAPLNHVCLPEGVNSIAFCARGEVGGEKIMTGGAGVPEAAITLTNEWKTFTVPLTGVTYNTLDKGVSTGFVWKIDPATTGAPALTEFFIDKIQFVKDAPGADYCGGTAGEGGAGGAN